MQKQPQHSYKIPQQRAANTTTYCPNIGAKVAKQNRIALNSTQLFAMLNKMEG